MNLEDTQDVSGSGLTPEAVEAVEDERLGRAPDDGDDDHDDGIAAAEREIAAAELMQIIHSHSQICNWLHVGFDDVSREDLRRASLSDDPKVQNARLGGIIEACGLVGDAYEMARADLIRSIADMAPGSEVERLKANAAATVSVMSQRCAAQAMQPGQNPAVMSLQIGNFSKLMRLGLELEASQERSRLARRPALMLVDANAALTSGGPAPQLTDRTEAERASDPLVDGFGGEDNGTRPRA